MILSTVETIARVVRAHIDDQTWRRILEDLARVPGNRSFRETIQRLINDLPEPSK